MDCRPHSVAFRKVLLLLCALLATWVTPSRGTTTKYPQALELCHSRSTSWVLCPIGPTMRVVTQSSEIAGFVQATRQLLLQRRTQDRLQVFGRGHPQARLKVQIHRCTQARFQVHRYSQAIIGARGRRLLTGAHRPDQQHRCPQAWLVPADQAPAAYSPVHTDQAPAAQVPAGACKLSSRCTGASRLSSHC